MKKYISIIAVFFTIGISGCKKDYLSLEVNPNQPSVSTPQLALSAALVGAASIVSNDYNEYGVWSGFWTTSGNYVPNQSINEYQFTNTSFDGPSSGPWYDLYKNLTNFNNLQNISTGAANGNFKAIAMIMKAFDFEQLVDSYNDVPYSQAFQPSTILFPAYDKGIDIYHDLGKQLDAAIALIAASTSATNPGTADVAFKGNMTGWAKFANTLKLRLAVRVSTMASGHSDALVTDLASTAGVGYLDGSLSATVNPGYSNTLAFNVDQANPFWGTYMTDVNGNPTFGNVYWRANTFSINFLNSNNDPRIAALYALTTNGNIYQGNVFGATSAVIANPFTSAIGPGLLKSPTQDAILFSGAESLFLQAEAALNGFGPGNAQTLYEAGITASFTSLGLTAAQAAAYYGQTLNDVGYANSSNKEEAIITQKWVALNGRSNLEAYNEYRRTGIPALPSSIDPAAISQTLPTRIYYPLSELSSNSISLGKEGTINPFTSKIFWAK